jgi:hypothetical protein
VREGASVCCGGGASEGCAYVLPKGLWNPVTSRMYGMFCFMISGAGLAVRRLFAKPMFRSASVYTPVLNALAVPPTCRPPSMPRLLTMGSCSLWGQVGRGPRLGSRCVIQCSRLIDCACQGVAVGFYWIDPVWCHLWEQVLVFRLQGM